MTIPLNLGFISDRQIINLIIAIERFDACWAGIEKREAELLASLQTMGAKQEAAEELQFQQILDQATDNTDIALFSYITEIHTTALIKCAIFCAYQHGKFAMASLKHQGYFWGKYLDFGQIFREKATPFFDSLPNNIEAWIVFFLSYLYDGLLYLMNQLDTSDILQNLTIKERLLMHIISHNPGIKTSAIAKKFGMSSATVKRKLNHLITNKHIQRHGSGRASHYTIL